MSPSPPPVRRPPFWLVAAGFLGALVGILGLAFIGFVLAFGR